MFKKDIKFIFSNLCLAVAMISVFCLMQFNQASASGAASDIRTQLDNTGTAGWGMAIRSNPQGSMMQIVQSVISAFLGLLGIIFLVLIIYAGFNWMTAQGDEEKVTTAKNTLQRAVIGLIIIVAAYSITYFVFTNLPGGDGGATADTTIR